MKLRAGVIGCGRIGSLWDENQNLENGKSPKTHAMAYHQSSRTELVAMCDISMPRAMTAAKFWNCAFYSDSVEEFLKQKPDLISVCVPLSSRESTLTQITQGCPDAALLIEKPFCESPAQGLGFLEILKAHRGKVLVNYSRRFASGIRQAKVQISAGHWGEFQCGTAYYGNGLLNNGSHAVDLLVYLLGAPTSALKGKMVADGRTEDPTLAATLFFGNSPVQLQGLDHRQYTVFEVDLFFTKGRIRLTERGFTIEQQSIIDDPEFAGFRIPGPWQSTDSGLQGALTSAVAEIADSSSPSVCTMDDAVLISKIIMQIREAHDPS